jgi:hypothetical protein
MSDYYAVPFLCLGYCSSGSGFKNPVTKSLISKSFELLMEMKMMFLVIWIVNVFVDS